MIKVEKEHKMYLVSADLKEVLARLSKRFDAGVAQKAERQIRSLKVCTDRLEA